MAGLIMVLWHYQNCKIQSLKIFCIGCARGVIDLKPRVCPYCCDPSTHQDGRFNQFDIFL